MYWVRITFLMFCRICMDNWSLKTNYYNNYYYNYYNYYKNFHQICSSNCCLLSWRSFVRIDEWRTSVYVPIEQAQFKGSRVEDWILQSVCYFCSFYVVFGRWNRTGCIRRTVIYLLYAMFYIYFQVFQFLSTIRTENVTKNLLITQFIPILVDINCVLYLRKGRYWISFAQINIWYKLNNYC